MVSTCIVPGCRNRYGQKSGIRFHRFPFNRKEILKKWLWNVRRLNWQPNRHSLICSEHFTADSYMQPAGYERPQLHPESVPTLFPHYPPHLQPKQEKPRQPNKLEIIHNKTKPSIAVPLVKPEPLAETKPRIDLILKEHMYCLQTEILELEAIKEAPSYPVDVMKHMQQNDIVKRLEATVLRNKRLIISLKKAIISKDKELDDLMQLIVALNSVPPVFSANIS